ncbi:MAG: bifunctional diguanylate cyclase/phosphodiesterase, partial [Chloroflexaceae bacterium]|nr:bifunctional diguanylate cyclase/phosphodiesterase [Chloroflexaceae bacterium]
DAFLLAIARRIQEVAPLENAMAARYGGDEFLILLCGTAAHTSTRMAHQIQAAFNQPVIFGQQEARVQISIGIAVVDEIHMGGEALLRDAHIALMEAKRQGHGEIVVYDEKLHQQAKDQLLLEHELRQALERDQFVIYYQPIVKLSTGEFVGLEALVRWQHPRRGLLKPAMFLSVAEMSSLVVEVDYAVMRKVCQQIARWLQADVDPARLVINVNLSGRTFVHPMLEDELRDALQTYHVAGKHIKLEITETVAIEQKERTIYILERLQRLGVQVALDDFGTGYASLSYVQHFPVQTIKLDASFLRSVRRNQKITAIIQAILDLAQSLEVDVVAEGVATMEQRVWLELMGCAYGQGFLFARPMDAASVLKMLRRNTIPLPDLAHSEAA